MKIVKARYYKATEEIIPLNPQPIRRFDGTWDYERTGTDENGDFVVIDFATEGDHYLSYDSEKPPTKAMLESPLVRLEITEDEWNKPAILDIENMDSLLSSVVNVDANISENLVTTSTEMNQATSPMETKSIISTTKQLFLNAYDAVKLNFQRLVQVLLVD